MEKCCKKTNFSPFQLVQLLSQFAIRETKLLQVDTQRSDVNITHLTRKLKIEDAYQFLLKHINSEALDSRRVDFMMLTGLALDEDDKLKEKTEELLEAFHTGSTNRYPREAKTKDDMVKQWLNMSDAPYTGNDDVFQEGSGSSKINVKIEGSTKKNKSKTLSTSSADEKLGTRRKSTYQTYQEAKATDKAADSFKRSHSQKTQKPTKSKSTT